MMMGTRELAGLYVATRARTERLAARLSPEDQQLQSMPDASPTKWHRAHTTWFFETFVLAPAGVPAVDPRHAFLFNSYYESVGPRHARPKRGVLSRPSAAEVGEYRRLVDERVLTLLERGEAAAPIVELGIAHEEQHQELLLTDILHAFSESPLQPAFVDDGDGAPTAGSAVAEAPLGFIPFAGGLVEIGAPADDAGSFTFDNERPRHKQWVEPFALADRLVTIAELQAFIDDGGYRTPSLWLAEGFDFVRAHDLTAPLHHAYPDGVIRVFTLAGARDARSDEPVAHVSYYEADAIARFLGARLPTEAEWETAATASRSQGSASLRTPDRQSRIGAPQGSASLRTTDAQGSASLRPTDTPGSASFRASITGNFLDDEVLRPQAARGSGHAPAARRLLGVDRLELRALPGLLRAARRARRVQWEIHGKPARTPRRLVSHAAPACPRVVSQLLAGGDALSDERRAPGALPMTIAEDVRRGLTATPKSLPPYLFYDEAGSRLYERITELPEYYLTRAERAIFAAHADEIIARVRRDDGRPLGVVELGAGSAAKTTVLLHALLTRQERCVYVPIDVSRAALDAAEARLRTTLPRVEVRPLVMRHDDAVGPVAALPSPQLLLFIGSSIGNLEDEVASALLGTLGRALGADTCLLLGTDLKKPAATLLPAYDDAAGVTAAFNKNLLVRLNRELGAHFDLDTFKHVARWNEAASRIEMHLESRVAQAVDLDALELRVRFAAGETIHTESSIKYDLPRTDGLLAAAGFTREATFYDEGRRFGVHLARALRRVL